MQLFKLAEGCYINPELVGVVDILPKSPEGGESTAEYDVKFFFAGHVATNTCSNLKTAVKLVDRYRRYCKKL